jgi:hypothetical protein
VRVARIAVDHPIPRYKLKKYWKKIIKHVCKVSTEFVQGSRPVLPQVNSLACVELYTSEDEETVKLRYELKALYCRGVLVRKIFYELRLSTEKIMFVKDSIALDCKVSYQAILGSKTPSQELSEFEFVRAYKTFMRLNPDALKKPVMLEAARKIGILSLILFEPSRQTEMMSNLSAGDAGSGGVYFQMNEKAWWLVHSWGLRSKRAKGIEYINNK